MTCFEGCGITNLQVIVTLCMKHFPGPSDTQSNWVAEVGGTSMGRRRGFFAELQHQAAVAQRERIRQAAAAERERVRLEKEMHRAEAAAAVARERMRRANAHAAVQAEREAKQLHIKAQHKKVESLNADLREELAAIDSILESTLAVDDYVDLERLRRVIDHPPFQSAHLTPSPPPAPITVPPEPRFQPPAPPTGISAVFAKKKHAAATAAAQARFEQAHAVWRAVVAEIPRRQLAAAEQHQVAEGERLRRLASDRRRYDAECDERQRVADAENARLDDLINRFEANDPAAVEEYVGIVFSNSIYPDAIAADSDIDFSYSSDLRELSITLLFPPPGVIPSTKSYRYVRTNDEITETKLTQKDVATRYANLINNMTLRTVHEVWESDRTQKIDSISLIGGVNHVDPAVGKDVFVQLIALAVHREDFMQIDLSRITPSETLKHLRAVMSKAPHRLTPINDKYGVRG
jgi:restriction system protein